MFVKFILGKVDKKVEFWKVEFSRVKVDQSAILSDLEFRGSDRISIDSGSFRMSKGVCVKLRSRIRS